MKFPRSARPFRGQLDAAPFAGVFFCLLLFLVLAALTRTPGTRIQLPEAVGLPGAEGPTLRVALDAHGQLYFENQVVERNDLSNRIAAAVGKSREPLTLVVEADKSVRYDALMNLTLLARSAGIKKAVLATLPRPFGSQGAAQRVP